MHTKLGLLYIIGDTIEKIRSSIFSKRQPLRKTDIVFNQPESQWTQLSLQRKFVFSNTAAFFPRCTGSKTNCVFGNMTDDNTKYGVSNNAEPWLDLLFLKLHNKTMVAQHASATQVQASGVRKWSSGIWWPEPWIARFPVSRVQNQTASCLKDQVTPTDCSHLNGT